MLKKNARINIRLSSKGLRGLQKKALTECIPYQTLVSSVLHKYVEGRLLEKKQLTLRGLLRMHTGENTAHFPHEDVICLASIR